MKEKFNFGNFLLSAVKCAGYLAIYFLVNIVASIPLAAANLNSTPEQLTEALNKSAIPITLLTNAVFILLTAVYYNKFSRTAIFSERVKRQPFNKKALPYIVCLGVCVIYSVNLIIFLAITFIPMPKEWIDMLNSNSEMILSSSAFMQILTVGIVGPIAEELLFRGLMLGSLSKHCNKWLAIVATSLVFGLVHGHPIAIIYASCLGILMGWLYCKTESLLAPIIFHMIYNLFSVLSPITSGIGYFIAGAMGTVISVSCIIMIAKIPKYTPPTSNDDNNNDEV